ncbi:acyl-CoA dehydrogenase domain-containing protein, partial [Legionella sp.]|uniref:acyl-CoA dehydrogenase domain-containing protein n=1 Tax=Legionella sp. TaxID=459 RepID=UPI003CA85A1D
GHKLARILIEPGDTRSRLTRLVYKKPGKNCPIGRLEEAFYKVCAVEELERKVMRAVKDHILKSLTLLNQIEEALSCNLLNHEEAKQLKEAELARQAIIKVDDFNDDELRRPEAIKIKSKKAAKHEFIDSEINLG